VSFLKRKIRLKFQLGQGNFGSSGQNTVTVPEGYQIGVQVSKAGGVSMSECRLRAYGLPLQLMNQLWTLNKQLYGVRKNVITVEAGDDESGMGVVFIGTVFQSWVNVDAPSASLDLVAYTGLLDATRPLQPTTIKGSADVSFIISGLAQQMGYRFENNGVNVRLQNQYLSGTGRDQILQAAKAANVNVLFDDTTGASGATGAPAQGTVAIWPKNSARNVASIPILSKDTGLIGYPSWTDNGLVLTSMFNPNITFGARVQVQSDITPANGTWTIFKVDHDLESETPDGRWFTRLEATTLGHTALAS
jgi:hypothetical protein